MSEIILIYGSGGLGVEILDLVQRTYEHKSKRPIFVDDINFGQTLFFYKYYMDIYFGIIKHFFH